MTLITITAINQSFLITSAIIFRFFSQKKYKQTGLKKLIITFSNANSMRTAKPNLDLKLKNNSLYSPLTPLILKRPTLPFMR